MSKYLIDTNIIIHYLKGEHNLNLVFDQIGMHELCISEISIAELRYGAAHSSNPVKNSRVIDQLVDMFEIVPIWTCLEFYGSEKARLRKSGNTIDDFDLLIGCTAVVNRFVMVTRNYKHFERISDIELENWIDSQ